MTEPTPTTPKPDKLVLTINPNEDLANLVDRLTEAHAAAEASKKAYEDLRTQLLATVTPNMAKPSPEVGSRIPDEFILVGTPVRVSWTQSVRIDSKRLKAELPSVYAGYAKASGGWRVTGL
jgi:hypothetical protein